MATESMRRAPRTPWLVLLCSTVLLASPGPAAQTTRPVAATRQDPVSAILNAFRSHQLVAVPAGHTDSNQTLALLQAILRDPRLPGTVNDIVVEFGSSRYQDLMDQYTRGEDVDEAALRQVWQNAVQAGIALDNPNTAAFFRLVRDLNATLEPVRQVRVLLGDPPIDWDNVRSKSDFRKWVVQRDSYPADLVRREVLTRKRRALILYANAHLLRKEILTNYDMSDWQAQTIISLLERPGDVRVFTIRSVGSLAKWQSDTTSWPPMSLTILRGTGLGAVDFAEYDNDNDTRYAIRGVDDFVPIPRDQWRSLRAEDQVDAFLYTGSGADRTTAPLSSTLCTDPNYVTMRLERIALAGLPPGEADRVKQLCGGR